MIGEIRDAETARIAVQSSLTVWPPRIFHAAHQRQRNGIPAPGRHGRRTFFVGATVRGVVARLVRRCVRYALSHRTTRR